jgi:hydroxylamine reductase
MERKVFCYQCEQTDRTGTQPGCGSAKGNCGKDATTADLQDLLIHAMKGIAQYAVLARAAGAPDPAAGRFILYGMFTTLTNVNFDASHFVALIREAAQVRDRLRLSYEAAAAQRGLAIEDPSGPAVWQPAPDTAGLLEQAAAVRMNGDASRVGDDVAGLRALVLYGSKGVCAYAHHAQVLGWESSEIFAGVEKTLDFLANDPTDVAALLSEALQVGALNLKTMELLDAANTGRFGTQEPSQARLTPIAGKATLVSGHDFGDLYALLEQTADSGIHVYTHGEMLPAHAYPKLKAFSHLIGNYGGAWQDQQSDFANFPGPILMTSNCLIEPKPQYRQRIFTTGPVGWPGVRHLKDHEFTELIKAARALPGFASSEPERSITIGFGGDAVLAQADKVIDAVKSGALTHFFVVGGCDGAAPGRNYYTEFAEGTPDNTIVMTLGCAKYRFNQHDFGSLNGIPRLLDIGQCNDSYSAIRIAMVLADAFGCSINDLPLSLVLSWFEQKAVAVFLALLALGVKNIRLGPTLPAFVTPAVLDVLVQRFGVKPIGSASTDLREILATKTA